MTTDDTMTTDEHMTSEELAQAAAVAIDDLKGVNTVLIDVSNLLYVTDVFVVATGMSNRHVRSIAEEVSDQLKQLHGRAVIRSEGQDTGEWVLLDYGEIVVHIFQTEIRAFYDLEHLWADAPRIPLAEPTT